MKEMWDKRYNQAEYVYGEEPNEFLKEQLEKIPAGLLLLPCEGEGRNAVYAVSQNWQVFAFDSSISAQEKALKLAKKRNVDFDFAVNDALDIEYPENHFDVAALVFAHFPPNIRTAIHQRILKWVKPGGRIILEGFSPAQLNCTSGGPQNVALLYDKAIIENDFKGMEFLHLETTRVDLNEGAFHKGPAEVIRFVGIKK